MATFYCLAVDPKAPQRTLWTKTVPYLKRPVVSSPAVVDDKLIFGDGMHETDGATCTAYNAAAVCPFGNFPFRARWSTWRALRPPQGGVSTPGAVPRACCAWT